MPVLKKITLHKIKEKKVNELTEKIKKAKTLMIVSVKSLPSRQFQEIKKSVREHAEIRVAKKNIMIRAIKAFSNDSILGLEKYITENCAFAISDVEGYTLAGILLKKKNPVFAKAGQISPSDISVKEGPTNLVPGPAISELGALGIQISVEGGKIAIKKEKVILKEGAVISVAVAAILQKLDIKPFTIGLEPICIYDISSGKIYSDIKIDSEETSKELASAAGKALGFAQKIGYYCKETIGYFLAKANMEANALKSKTGGKE
jgi:large subunit ribosomal protein L10